MRYEIRDTRHEKSKMTLTRRSSEVGGLVNIQDIRWVAIDFGSCFGCFNCCLNFDLIWDTYWPHSLLFQKNTAYRPQFHALKHYRFAKSSHTGICLRQNQTSFSIRFGIALRMIIRNLFIKLVELCGPLACSKMRHLLRVKRLILDYMFND